MCFKWLTSDSLQTIIQPPCSRHISGFLFCRPKKAVAVTALEMILQGSTYFHVFKIHVSLYPNMTTSLFLGVALKFWYEVIILNVILGRLFLNISHETLKVHSSSCFGSLVEYLLMHSGALTNRSPWQIHVHVL